MNSLLSQSDDLYDRLLAEARGKALELGWDVIESLGGVVAVPRGTGIIAALTIDALMARLREHEERT